MDPLIMVAGASVIGAGLNTLRGYLHSKEPYSSRKSNDGARKSICLKSCKCFV